MNPFLSSTVNLGVCGTHRTEITELKVQAKQLKAIPDKVCQLVQLKSLIFSRNALTVVPRHFSRLSNLAWLDLSQNQLKTLSPRICSIPQLNTLKLSSNRIITVPKEVSRLTQLHRLELSRNRIKILCSEIGGTSSLREARFNTNQLKRLPQTIGLLQQLTVLELKENLLKVLPDEIGGLTSLTRLELCNNRLSSCPPTIGQLDNLRRLLLNNNRLPRLPAEIGRLSRLERLALENNVLQVLPDQMGGLVALSKLTISNNQLATLPSSFSALRSLRHFIASRNKIAAIPTSYGNLVSLTQLDLRDNRLTTLPQSLSQLSKLRFLWIQSNQLTQIPGNLLRNLDQMHRIAASRNPLTAFSVSLSTLRHLELNGCDLTTLPSLSSLPSLTNLFVQNNRLQQLPRGLSSLTNLISLRLNQNKIAELPSTISRLQALQELWITRNSLQSLPSTIGALHNLRILWLSDNRLASVPPELVRCTNLQDLVFKRDEIPISLQLKDLSSILEGEGGLYEAVQKGEAHTVHQGFGQATEHAFKNRMNFATALVRMLIFDALVLKGSSSKFTYDHGKGKLFVTRLGKRFNFHKILAKTKWDLITLSPPELRSYKNFYPIYFLGQECQIASSFVSTLGRSRTYLSKQHLYVDLDDAEKEAIYLYTREIPPFFINPFLRNFMLKENFNQAIQMSGNRMSYDSLSKEMLAHTAVCVSGLNKTKESPTRSGLVFRMENNRDRRLYDLVRAAIKKGKTQELAFASTADGNPAEQFWRGRNTVKVCQNPAKAKDVSVLSDFPEERERLFLPGTKERLLTVKRVLSGAEDDEKFAFQVKHESKHQGIK